MKLNPSLNVWSCFKSSLNLNAALGVVTSTSNGWTTSDVPVNYETYTETNSLILSPTISLTSTATSIVVTPVTTGCSRVLVLAPQLDQYKFEFQRFSNIRIFYNFFNDCVN